MAKKQEIKVKTVYDGKQSDKQAFVKLMVEKYRLDNTKDKIDKTQGVMYNDSGLNKAVCLGE